MKADWFQRDDFLDMRAVATLRDKSRNARPIVQVIAFQRDVLFERPKEKPHSQYRVIVMATS